MNRTEASTLSRLLGGVGVDAVFSTIFNNLNASKMENWQREMYLVRRPYPSEIGKIKDFLAGLQSYLCFQNPADKNTDSTAVWEAHRTPKVGEYFMSDRWDADKKEGRIVLCRKSENGIEEIETLLPKSNYALGGQPNGCWILPYHFINF